MAGISKALIILFFTLAPQLSGASCMERLLAQPSSFLASVYLSARADGSLGVGALPEELLAELGRESERDALILALANLDVRRVRWGSRFEFEGWGSHRTLVVARPDLSTSETREAQRLSLMQVLLREKQRRMRYEWSAETYVFELVRFSDLLLELKPQNLPKPISTTWWSLRWALGFPPNGGRLFPLGEGQARAHWRISRLATALYASVVVAGLSHAPEAVDVFTKLYQLRHEMLDLGRELERGYEIDGRAARLRLIQQYEAKLDQLEREWRASVDPSSQQQLNERIERLKQIIDSLRRDLA